MRRTRYASFSSLHRVKTQVVGALRYSLVLGILVRVAFRAIAGNFIRRAAVARRCAVLGRPGANATLYCGCSIAVALVGRTEARMVWSGLLAGAWATARSE
jgi:hypothetical protein